MQFTDDRFIFSASDLVAHLACAHLTQLQRLAALGEVDRPVDDRSEVDLIRRLGDEHELRYLEQLRAEGYSIAEIADPARGPQGLVERHDETVAAMRRGADVVFQATFFDGTWRGHADFLFKVDGVESSLGDWAYEPYDTKLARSAKVSALVQLADYAHHLEAVQGAVPARVHIVLGDQQALSFETRLLQGYHRRARERLLGAVASPVETYPEPVSHCSVCSWFERCDEQRRRDDHLALVAGVGAPQIKSLRTVGIETAQGLAGASVGEKPVGMQEATWDRIRAQARLQRRSDAGPQFELLDPQLHPTGGFGMLPEPDPADLFFDIEGDPHRGFESAGLEYLWGVTNVDDEFTEWWAHDVDEERRAFEACVDHFIDAFEQNPSMHVYHYAPYETTVLKRLASRYASRVDEVDHLLRNQVFVDLYAVARHAVRINAERLSIKDLEAFYRDERVTEVQSGMESVVQYEAWLETAPLIEERDQSILDDIGAYNLDDCVSTRQLRDWLEQLRAEAVAAGAVITRPSLPPQQLPAATTAWRQQVAATREALLGEWEVAEHAEARALLAGLLEFHDREAKPQWWKHFAQIEMSPEELWADTEAVSGLVDHGIVGTVARSVLFKLTFDPEQPHKLKPGKMLDHAIGPNGKHREVNIETIDAAEGSILVRQGQNNDAPMPKHLIAQQPMSTRGIEEALFAIGNRWLRPDGLEQQLAIRDLLMRLPAHLREDESLVIANESASDAVIRAARALDNGCLAVQGPPGTGKTYTGARMIDALVKDGRRVGVVSNSHRVIENMLEAVVEVDGFGGRVLKVGGEPEGLPPRIDNEASRDAEQAVLAGDYDVVGGTVWFFSRPGLREQFDVLVVDEAGQFSLANTVAAATAAHNLVLLGDPQQLDQPMQGSHPHGVAVSALSHYLGDDKTIDAEVGIFLDDTWRMSEPVCKFVSDNFYDGRLDIAPHAPSRTITGVPAGIYWEPVEHELNKARSHEEAAKIAEIISSLVGLDYQEDGAARPLTVGDIMVITPFNAQVGAVRAELARSGPDGAQVGTVDLFQGREAPVVIYSLTSSRGDLAPRGIDFLLSANRFNVAVSRAQVAAIVVANPALLDTNAKRPEQVPLVGALCNYVDVAHSLEIGEAQ